MAKWEESDPRWRVADLGDQGRNVNNWHWQERDALPWARARLQALLEGLPLGGGAAATGLERLDGEAVVNNRKNKIIAAYELSLAVGWRAPGAGGGGDDIAGELRLPYVSEENHDEDPEVVVVVTRGEGAPGAAAARDAVVAEGRAAVRAAVRTFVAELRAGGPMRGGGAAADGGGAPANGAAAAPAPAAAPAAAAAAKAAAAPAAAPAGDGTSTVEMTQKFFASRRDIYECFADAGRMAAFTRAPAEAEPRPGGRFSLFGGSVTGTYVSVTPGEAIELEWRFNNWAEGVTSRVQLTFEEPDRGAAVVRLRHAGIPAADAFGNRDVAGVVEAGWRDRIFYMIRSVFGYGV